MGKLKDLITHFKSLPTYTKFIFTLGITLAFVAALPIFVWGVVTQNFNIREKAQSATITPATPINKNVLILIYNPIIESAGNQKLSIVKGWQDPDTLSASVIQKFKEVSGGLLNYTIAERIELDSYPVKADGFTYTDETYLDCATNGGASCHSPDAVNYLSVLTESQACEKRNAGLIDEIWVWGGPWLGFWESNLAGPNGFYYNSPPTAGSTCNSLLPIMGLNFERTEAEALHSFGHRMESTMLRVYGTWENKASHSWNKFALRDIDLPGSGGCGNVHGAFNSPAGSDYNYAVKTFADTSCNDFSNYPNLTGAKQSLNCDTWGCSQLGYLEWWFSHIPKTGGVGVDGKFNNWWDYFANPESKVKEGTFSYLSALLSENTASFTFNYTGGADTYRIDMSTRSDMSTDVYVGFVRGNSTGLVETNPKKWDKYVCGATLYWRVVSSIGLKENVSSIDSRVIDCASPQPSPTPTATPTPTPTATPTPTPFASYNPSPTPVASSVPTWYPTSQPTYQPSPSAIACIRSTPTMKITPYIQSANAGTLLSYQVNFTNNDINCPDTRFDFSVQVPTGWTANPLRINLLASGQSASDTLAVTSSLNASFNPHPVTLRSSSTASGLHQTSQTVAYGILQTPSPVPSPKPTTKPNQAPYITTGIKSVFGNSFIRLFDRYRPKKAYTISITGADDDMDMVQIELVNPKSWVSLNQSQCKTVLDSNLGKTNITCPLSFRPPKFGVYPITIKISDVRGASSTSRFNLLTF